MDLLNIIKQRRSIREYKSNPVDKIIIEKILEAGRWAPSGLNNQPWRFLIIEGKEKLSSLAKFTKYGKVIEVASCAIGIFMDTSDSYDREKDILAIGACIQNMLLEAHTLGVGTCWLGEILKKRDEVCEFLGVSSNLELFAVIVVGHAGEFPKTTSRKKLCDLVIR